jgi:BMFP domain-containing protein YqiC
MQDPELLIDTILDTMPKARAKEARLRTRISELEARIAPLEIFPLPEDMDKSALTKSRRELLKARKR